MIEPARATRPGTDLGMEVTYGKASRGDSVRWASLAERDVAMISLPGHASPLGQRRKRMGIGLAV